MNQIDWSKAPEGATHWDTGGNSRLAGWMRLSDGVWNWWPVEGATCEKKWYSTGNTQPVESFIQRKNQWNGEGLPPVGTVCERNIARSAWCETTILAHSTGSRVCAGFQDMAGQLGWSGDASMFRPIRTPEQIATKEKKSMIGTMADLIRQEAVSVDVVLTHSQALSIANTLYIDEYRKQVKP